RLVLAPRIEDIAGPGFDDTAHAEALQQTADAGHALAEIDLEGIERVVVHRDGNTAITQLGQETDRNRQAMVGETVGVVTEYHGRSPFGGVRQVRCPLRERFTLGNRDSSRYRKNNTRDRSTQFWKQPCVSPSPVLCTSRTPSTPCAPAARP